MSEADAALAAVSEILRVHCGKEGDIGRETHFLRDLGLDSVGALTLLVELENRYRVRLEESPENPPMTVGELVDLLLARLADEGVPA